MLYLREDQWQRLANWIHQQKLDFADPEKIVDCWENLHRNRKRELKVASSIDLNAAIEARRICQLKTSQELQR